MKNASLQLRRQSIADPDSLFPGDPRARDVARELYSSIADAPILSPHGHVDPSVLVDDSAFANPADLFITHDHYVTRLLFASGVSFAEIGLDPATSADPRDVWRVLAQNWHQFAGTASGYWLMRTLAKLFGIEEELSGSTADSSYDLIQKRLSEPAFRPRSLFHRFQIEVLATTDDPLDDLEPHRELASARVLNGRVIPTFRPDRYLEPGASDFDQRVQGLLDRTGESGTYAGYLRALFARRAYFVEHGAVSADHGVVEAFTAEIGGSDAERLFQSARKGSLDPGGERLLRGALLFEMARMSVADGLVMTIHPGVMRNHHTPTSERYGPDTGHDIPVRAEFTQNLRPLLNAFGTAPGFHLVLFTVDETAFSRELAPLAGFYPSVYVGAPWWFLDAPDAIARFRSGVTETAGFYRSSGFIDDTRAFLSIPARHDASRRLDSAFLARLAVEGRLTMPTAQRIAHDLVDGIPRKAFKL